MSAQFDECARQHLDFIQSNIARMNSCSFQMKGWTGTVVAALLAVYAAIDSHSGATASLFVASGFAPLIAFAFLDAYYLKMERVFRKLYNEIITQNKDDIKIPVYSMHINTCTDERCSFRRALSSITVLGFYLPLLLAYAGAIYFSS